MFKGQIGARFPMKDLGKLKFVLGVRVDYIPGGEMVLSQGAFPREVLKRFCAETGRTPPTPGIAGEQLLPHTGPSDIGGYPYLSAVGSSLLVYVFAARPGTLR